MSPAPIKPLIDMAVLDTIDVRVGRIESVLAIEGADKLPYSRQIELKAQGRQHRVLRRMN